MPSFNRFTAVVFKVKVVFELVLQIYADIDLEIVAHVRGAVEVAECAPSAFQRAVISSIDSFRVCLAMRS